ncbi:hypothetical protein ACFV4N_21840 [Actinosynnema sp. NPDC059797]
MSMGSMSSRKALGWVAFAVGFVALIGGGIVVWIGLEDADKLGSVVGAGCALVGLAVTIYGVIVTRSMNADERKSNSQIRLSRSGDASATGKGMANSGISGQSGDFNGSVFVKRTGTAKAEGDGNSNTGIELN